MVHVQSCRFLRLSCSADDHPLFRREYARSNRERGVKLLRCFPHCCPEHARRSYCGCSVHVLVTFDSDASARAAAESSDLLVCARFEPSRVAPLWPASLAHLTGLARDMGASAELGGRGEDMDASRLEDERSLGIGESVVLPASVFGPAGRIGSSDSVWIRADRESDAKQQAFPKNSVLYVVNNRRFPKWFYSYDSSVTRIQRDMTHHFVAYVFQLAGGAQEHQSPDQAQQRHQLGETEDPRNAVVLARLASPSFLLLSYRRSGSSLNTNSPASEVSTVDSLQDHGGRTNDDAQNGPPQSRALHRAIASRHVSDQARKGRYSDIRAQQSPASMSARNREAYIFRRDGNVPVRTTSDTLWQREADIVALNTKGQHLLILWQFVQHLSVGDIGPNTIGPSVRSYCLRVKSVFEARLPSVGARLEGAIDSFLHDLFGLFSDGSSATDLRDQVNKNSHPAQEGIIASLVAHVFLRSVSSRRVYNLVRSACTVQNDSIGKDQLHDRFVSLVLSLYDTVHDELVEVSRGTTWAARQNQESSVSALVDGVLSLVYSEARYCALRPAMSALLMGQQTPGSTSDALNHAFQVFMAQIREAMIAGSTQHHGIGRRQQQRASESTVTASESMCGSGWNHLWLIKPASIELVDVESERVRDCRYDLCLVSVMQLVSELGCVDLHLDDAQTTLSLRSALPLSNDTYGTRMELVLDGRLRVFRVLPSSVSSMIPLAGGWCVGDYAAALASDRRSVSIDMFGFTEEKVTIFADRSSGQVISQEEIRQEFDYRSVSNVRRVRLSIELDPEFCRGNRSTSREASVKVHGTVSSSTYRPLRSSPTQEWFKLSEMPSSRRAAIWNELDWRPLLELQARYVSIRDCDGVTSS